MDSKKIFQIKKRLRDVLKEKDSRKCGTVPFALLQQLLKQCKIKLSEKDWRFIGEACGRENVFYAKALDMLFYDERNGSWHIKIAVSRQAKSVPKSRNRVPPNSQLLMRKLNIRGIDCELFEEMKEKFTKLDPSNTGLLARDVFIANCLEPMNLDESSRLAILRLCQNPDGRISYVKLGKLIESSASIRASTSVVKNSQASELYLLKKRVNEQFPTMQAAFKYFDADKDDLISLSEFRHGIRTLGSNVHANLIQQIFQEIDKGRTNSIDLPTFIEALEIKNQSPIMSVPRKIAQPIQLRASPNDPRVFSMKRVAANMAAKRETENKPITTVKRTNIVRGQELERTSMTSMTANKSPGRDRSPLRGSRMPSTSPNRRAMN